jgi:hypothetical protein
MAPNIPTSQPKNAAAQLRSIYMQTALSNPCLFHATLYGASAHLDIVRGQDNGPVTVFHRGRTLQLINNSLGDQDTALSDSVLGAIITLRNFEVSQVTR